METRKRVTVCPLRRVIDIRNRNEDKEGRRATADRAYLGVS